MNRGPVRPQPPEVLSEIHAKKVDLYLHQQGLDTTTPAGKAMFQMMGVFAEFERAMTRERVKSGLARARRRQEARPPDDRSQEGARDPRGVADREGWDDQDRGALRGRRGTVQRIKADLGTNPDLER